MDVPSGKTALVTGANSGIGFEAAAQLAESGFGRVILACRSLEKAKAAQASLVERCGQDVFEGLAVDVAERESVSAAVQELATREKNIDLLLLNAGAGLSSRVVRNSDGVDITFASMVIGHHRMTMLLLGEGLLSEHARIIITGSEAARGDAPGMKVFDLAATARDHFDGDMVAAMESVARAQPPHEYKPNHAYANAKLWSVWWAAVLSQKLASGQTVNTVSPGSAPSTNFGRDAPWFMRSVMVPMMRLVGPLFSMAGPVSTAARRYLDAAAFGDDTTGGFYASPPGKLVGPLQLQGTPPHLFDKASQEACWQAVVRLAGEVDYPAA